MVNAARVQFMTFPPHSNPLPQGEGTVRVRDASATLPGGAWHFTAKHHNCRYLSLITFPTISFIPNLFKLSY